MADWPIIPDRRMMSATAETTLLFVNREGILAPACGNQMIYSATGYRHQCNKKLLGTNDTAYHPTNLFISTVWKQQGKI